MPSHTQALNTQCSPAPQAGLLPQVQTPSALQPSEVAAEHTLHASPPTPQLAAVGVRQSLAEQHPRQLDAQPLHAPPLQVWPVGQDSQVSPAAPQAVAFSL